MFSRTNHDASSTCLLSPCLYSLHKPPVLPRMEASWELLAEFLEQLRRRDIGATLKSPAHEWPDHIRATSPVVSGSVQRADARRVILDALPHLRDRIRAYKDVQGTISFKYAISNGSS